MMEFGGVVNCPGWGGIVGYFRGWVRVGSMLGGGYVWSRFYLLVWGPTVIAYYFLKEITN